MPPGPLQERLVPSAVLSPLVARIAIAPEDEGVRREDPDDPLHGEAAGADRVDEHDLSPGVAGFQDVDAAVVGNLV